jgi:hypothetical protein
MKLPKEQINSITRTRKLLSLLTDCKRAPGTPIRVREEAARCLENYPTAQDIDEAIDAWWMASEVFEISERFRARRRRQRGVD